MPLPKHKCGQCSLEFETRQEYLDHTCVISGVKPVELRNMGKNHAKISEAALARGEARKNK